VDAAEGRVDGGRRDVGLVDAAEGRVDVRRPGDGGDVWGMPPRVGLMDAAGSGGFEEAGVGEAVVAFVSNNYMVE